TAIGCSLYTYPPSKIVELADCAANNIRRVHRSTLARLQARFPALTLVTMDRRTQVDLRTPTPAERTLVTQALAGLAPWTSHLTRLPGASLWKSHFADKAPSEMVEREQVHALVDPQCAGLAQLICDYNDYLGVTSTKRLDPPEAQLGVPRSLATDAASSGASPPAPDRFQP